MGQGTGGSSRQQESVGGQAFIQPKAEPPGVHRLPQGVKGNKNPPEQRHSAEATAASGSRSCPHQLASEA